ncbi:MAG: proteasome accessory factor PafA2 [Actinomycetia bacterium]|nr:proteasome accessory factor PafA2 [Actinomycetes bacterium]
MAVPKICGVETEFGIIHSGVEDSNPISASSMLINAYVQSRGLDVGERTMSVGWDFEDESPHVDARELYSADALAPEVETHLVNAVLTNGARYYVDHAHPELSTPEVTDALSIVIWDRAAELIAIESMRAATEILPPGQELIVYKNNSDRKGNSYGCHENYLVGRSVPFGRIVNHATTHFISRQIYTGAGKVGTEMVGMSSSEVPFQLTQRADFFEEEVGLETTLKRPIINTRDEPHCDPQKYRRLHVIVGDANLSEVSTFLKVGTTGIVLAMVEDDIPLRQFVFSDPVRALQQVSHDLSLSAAIALADGSTITALEIQWDLFAQARKYADDGGLECVGEESGAEVMRRWEQVLTALESDPMSLADQLDWVAKYRVINGYRERHDLAWDDPRLAAMDLQYHDIRPGRSLFERLGVERIADPAAAVAAMTTPPPDTRAYFRGRALSQFAPDIVAANWDSIVFDVGVDPLRRVPMMEPTRGTEAHVGALFDEVQSSRELLDKLGS